MENHHKAIQYYRKGRKLIELAPHWWTPRFDFLNALLLLSDDAPQFDLAEECFAISIDGDEKVGAVVPAAQTRYHLALLFDRKGDKAASKRMLAELRGQFQQWGIGAWRRKCEKEL